MEERKYFDYYLAYNGYKEFEKMWKQCGKDINKITEYYDTNADLEDLDKYFDISFHLEDYNCYVYIEDVGHWQLSNVIDLISYSGGEDTIYIDDIDIIQDRLKNLQEYAMKNDYDIKDVKLEKESLEKLLKVFERNKK